MTTADDEINERIDILVEHKRRIAELEAALDTIAHAPTVGGISSGERKGLERAAAVARAALAKGNDR